MKMAARVCEKSIDDTLKEPGNFFSIIMDKTTDNGTVEKGAFTIIYIEENHVRTAFFDMFGTSSGTAKDLFPALIKISESLLLHKLKPETEKLITIIAPNYLDFSYCKTTKAFSLKWLVHPTTRMSNQIVLYVALSDKQANVFLFVNGVLAIGGVIRVVLCGLGWHIPYEIALLIIGGLFGWLANEYKNVEYYTYASNPKLLHADIAAVSNSNPWQLNKTTPMALH
ncbi:unnamed protein product [Timema podura]|uniref:DUF4371 domain-containing protein n=1 Tax=Timema podura TaxID=61482 RepID=A0ABN7NGD7_TIMPD|nr:unnamed protein product [Timema podura]